LVVHADETSVGRVEKGLEKNRLCNDARKNKLAVAHRHAADVDIANESSHPITERKQVEHRLDERRHQSVE